MEKGRKHSEEELIALLNKRDQEAFSYLYDHYAPVLNGIILRLIGDGPQSEDILKEVFLSIWTSISRYDASKESLFTWMIKIARTISNDRIRSKGFRQPVRTSDNKKPLPDIIHVLLAEKEFNGVNIKKQLSRLTNEQLLILELAYFHGYSQDAIAKKIGIPQEAIKASVRLTMLELRKIL